MTSTRRAGGPSTQQLFIPGNREALLDALLMKYPHMLPKVHSAGMGLAVSSYANREKSPILCKTELLFIPWAVTFIPMES